MKKLFALLLCGIILLSFAGCATKSKPKENKQKENETDILNEKENETDILNDIKNTMLNINGSTSNDALSTDEPFIVYLSASDSRDLSDINSGLTDANLIMAVDPAKHKILVLNTPRDYLLPLYGGDVSKNDGEGELDKLTHAGLYGIDCSIKTLEKFYNIDIDRYIRINFKAVVDSVDAIGGITVNSDYDFSSSYGLNNKTYQFKKGANTLDGDATLAFVRERKSLEGGDRQRRKNQLLVIEALVDKLLSPSSFSLKNIQKLLSACKGNVTTDFFATETISLLTKQLNNLSSWSVDFISVDGNSGVAYTYTYPNQSLLVISPYTSDGSVHESVVEARKALANFLK